MGAPKHVLIATNNSSKQIELQALLQAHGIRVVLPADLSLALTVEETGSTFAANAALKAEAFAAAARLVSLADDSGLCVDALEGEPGVRSARYGGSGASDRDRMALVLARLEGVPPKERTARFVAAVAVAAPGLTTRVFEGAVEGYITDQPRGDAGFGYDPIFHFPPAGQTFGEMTASAKASVSHRARALARAVPALLDLLESYT